MKAIIVDDKMNSGNEGKVVRLLTKIPKLSRISIHEEGYMPDVKRVARDVWLVSGITRVRNKAGETKKNIEIRYCEYAGTDLVSEDEIEFLISEEE